MKVDIIPIGNTEGIRIPAALLAQCEFGECVEINIEKNKLILSPTKSLRKGWVAEFKKMAKNQDDNLVESPPTGFDDTEWSW